MSYSSSGAVATLWSPSNYSGTTKMPVPSTTRRYTTTTGTSSYRTTGSTERPYFNTATSSYSTASRSVQTEYRSRYTPQIRSSTSVPTSYSRLSEIHETSSRIVNKDRSDTNDSNLLSYSRSKTDNDVSSALDRYVLKTDNYKLRSDPVNRFFNTSNLDSKYSPNRKYTTGTSLDLSRFSRDSSSLSKSSKTSVLNSRTQRKDSLTKPDNAAETSPSPIRSLERKSSTSAAAGGSASSPIEIRKSSEVWNKRLSGSYESTVKGGFESDFFQKIDNKNQAAKMVSRENSEDLSESSIFLENIESEEKTLSFAEIRRKFNNNNSNNNSNNNVNSSNSNNNVNNDLNSLKGGFENSKSSHLKDSKATISNGVILGVHNFGQIPYLDRSSKCRTIDDPDANEISDCDQLDSNNSFPSSQTLHGLKRIPSNLKNNSNNSTNVSNIVSSSNNNGLAFPNPRKSPDPDVSNSIKKRSLPDLKKAILSPEKKDGSLPPMVAKLTGLPEAGNPESDEPGGSKVDAKRESRKSMISATLALDNKTDLKIQPKKKGEKLLKKLEQTLSKPLDRDSEMLNTLSRLRKSPESKSKDFENETKVIELRRLDPFVTTPFENVKAVKEPEVREKKPVAVQKGTERSPQRTSAGAAAPKQGRSSPVKEIGKVMEGSGNVSPVGQRKDIGTKPKKTSLKDEKETSNARERELHKRLLNEDLVDLTKTTKKTVQEDKTAVVDSAKEAPLADKSEYSKNLNTRTLPGPSAYQSTNSYSSNENLENAGIHGTSPRLSLGYSRNSGIDKGGLNGLRNIGNTCFMNSVIQCLSNTKPLLEYLLNEDYLSDINTTISGMKGALIKAFSNVIQELWAPNAEYKIINTTNFKSQVQRFAPRFMGYSQQDAQEFLRYLLEGLHEDVNRVTAKPKPITTDIEDTLSDNQKAAEAWKRYLRMDDSKVVDIFVGQLKSTLQCTSCGHCSVTFDPFWDLSLPVPNRNGQPKLLSCLDAFTKEEVLDGDEKPTCSKCKTRRKCTKSFSIQKFPKILVLHLKRFSTTERNRGKLSVTVEFPLTSLDLSAYAANRGQSCTYNLYAISNHSGTAFSGHYTAYCKHPYTGNWHEYNDSGVSSLSSRSVVSGEAYVLFYELAAQTSHL